MDAVILLVIHEGKAVAASVCRRVNVRPARKVRAAVRWIGCATQRPTVKLYFALVSGAFILNEEFLQEARRKKVRKYELRWIREHAAAKAWSAVGAGADTKLVFSCRCCDRRGQILVSSSGLTFHQ